MEKQYRLLVDKALETGALEAKMITTDRVIFDPRSHLKCRFGCNRWGRYWTCPPNLHISPEQFTDAFSHYKMAVIIKSADPESGQDAALGVEKEAMLNHGCTFAFAMALCVQCEECAYPQPCKHPHLARPTMDAYGVDIGKTVKSLGFKVEFDPQGQLLPAWYSMVLLD